MLFIFQFQVIISIFCSGLEFDEKRDDDINCNDSIGEPICETCDENVREFDFFYDFWYDISKFHRQKQKAAAAIARYVELLKKIDESDRSGESNQKSLNETLKDNVSYDKQMKFKHLLYIAPIFAARAQQKIWESERKIQPPNAGIH